MGKYIILVFLIPLLVGSATGSFSFFGFGSKQTEENLETAASDSVVNHSLGSRFIPQSITNILFGTGTSSQNSGSGLSGVSGVSAPAPGLLPLSVPTYPGPSVQSPPAYGSVPSTPAPAYGTAPAQAYGGAPAAPAPAYGSPSPAGYGSVPASLPAPAYGGYTNNYNNAQTQTQAQNQNYAYSAAPLPQPHSAGLPLHNSNLPSNSPAHAFGMSLLNSGNTQSNLGHQAATTTVFQNQHHLGQGQASHAVQTSNGIRFNEETNTQGNQQASGNNPGTHKKGSFSWISPEGQKFEVQYVADSQGYRASGAHLPTPNAPQLPNDSLKQFKGPMNQSYGPSQHSGAQYSSGPSAQSPPSTSYGSAASVPTYSYSQFKPSQPVPARPY